LPVRLVETVSSDRNHPGDTLTASLDAPLVVDGFVIAERGARAEGRIVETQQAGKVKGLASIAIELTRLSTSDGQRVEISTDTFTKMGPESKGSDAAKIGGGAALGAIMNCAAETPALIPCGTFVAARTENAAKRPETTRRAHARN